MGGQQWPRRYDLCFANSANRQLADKDATMTNVNFNKKRFSEYIRRAIALGENLIFKQEKKLCQ